MDGLVIFLVCLILCVPLILMMVAEKCSDEVFEVVKCVFGHLGSFGDWCFDKLQVRRDSKSGERDAYVYADSFKDGVTYTSKEVSNGVERDVAWLHSVPLSNGGISNLLFLGILPALCVVYWLWFFLSNSIVPAWDIQDISFTCVVSLMISAILSGLGIFIGLTRVISPARISVPDPYALSNEIMIKSNPKYYKWVIKFSAVSLVGALYLFNFCGFGDVLIKDFGDSGLGKGFSSIRFYPRSTGDALMDAVQYVYNEEERNEQQKPQSNSFNDVQTENYNLVYDGIGSDNKYYSVTSKTFFYDSPEEHAKRKAYLIKGETVFIEKIQNKFGYTIFTNARGQITKGWLKMADLVDENVNDNKTQTENYNYYSSTVCEEEVPFKVKIIYEKKEIKIVTPEKTSTYIIVGSPKYDGYATVYNGYYSDDADKITIRLERYQDETHIVVLDETGGFETFIRR